jgi:hypothetical protein
MIKFIKQHPWLTLYFVLMTVCIVINAINGEWALAIHQILLVGFVYLAFDASDRLVRLRGYLYCVNEFVVDLLLKKLDTNKSVKELKEEIESLKQQLKENEDKNQETQS